MVKKIKNFKFNINYKEIIDKVISKTVIIIFLFLISFAIGNNNFKTQNKNESIIIENFQNNIKEYFKIDFETEYLIKIYENKKVKELTFDILENNNYEKYDEFNLDIDDLEIVKEVRDFYKKLKYKTLILTKNKNEKNVETKYYNLKIF